MLVDSASVRLRLKFVLLSVVGRLPVLASVVGAPLRLTRKSC